MVVKIFRSHPFEPAASRSRRPEEACDGGRGGGGKGVAVRGSRCPGAAGRGRRGRDAGEGTPGKGRRGRDAGEARRSRCAPPGRPVLSPRSGLPGYGDARGARAFGGGGVPVRPRGGPRAHGTARRGGGAPRLESGTGPRRTGYRVAGEVGRADDRLAHEERAFLENYRGVPNQMEAWCGRLRDAVRISPGRSRATRGSFAVRGGCLRGGRERTRTAANGRGRPRARLRGRPRTDRR